MQYNEGGNTLNNLTMKVNKDYVVLQEVTSESQDILTTTKEYEVRFGDEMGAKASFDIAKAKRIVVKGVEYIVVKQEDVFLYY